MIKNIFLAFVLDLIWTMLMRQFLLYLFKANITTLSEVAIDEAIQAQISLSVLSIFGVVGVLSAKPLLQFFFSCVFAPLWEEALFRYGPFALIQGFVKKNTRFWILPAIIATSIIFGWMHGSVINILFQGVSGMLLAWVYLKNRGPGLQKINYGYCSAVIAHFLWNVMVIFGLPSMK
ncbi:MAG: CPBP family intramembrane glutamic endopeptidase [Candidatus Paceibacterota bacterium]|jgi:membrane protease YdiL (CAAX protease family)